MARTEQTVALFFFAVCAAQAATSSSSNWNYDDSNGNKPDQAFNIDGGFITSGAKVGVHSELPSELKPLVGTVFFPNYLGRIDNEASNKKENNPLVIPVFIPGENGQVSSGTVSQDGKVPAYYIIMISGKPILVKNPAANLSDSNGALDIDSILGQFGGIGGMTIGGFWEKQPVNVQPVLTEQVPVSQPVITEQIQVPQPVLTEHIQFPQPVFNIAPPVYPGGPYGYPNIPYPYPTPSMWNSRNLNMNWPNIIKFLINLGAHQQLPKLQPHHMGDVQKPITKNPIQVKPTERNVVKPTEATIIVPKATPIWRDTKPPFVRENTDNPNKHVTHNTPRTPIVTKYTRSPVLTKATVAPTHVSKAILHEQNTHSPNGYGKNNNSKPKTTTNPDLTQNKEPTEISDNSSKKGNILHIPLQPGYDNDESIMTSGPYDPTLINLLNVVLKMPNKASHPTTKPSGDHESLKKLLESILKSKAGNNLLPNPQPSGEEKIFKELLDLLKSKHGDKALKQLIFIMQHKVFGKGHPSHKILGILNDSDDENVPNIAILLQLLFNLLNSYNSQPYINVLVQEPGINEETRSNLIILLNILASELGSKYGLGGASMGVTGIGGTGMGVAGISGPGIGVAGLAGIGIGVPSLGGVGMGLGRYEQVNPASLNFLGQLPCDFSSIHSGVDNQALERGLWQLLSSLYGYRGDLNSVRLGRSAEDDDGVHPTA